MAAFDGLFRGIYCLSLVSNVTQCVSFLHNCAVLQVSQQVIVYYLERKVIKY